MDKSEEKQTLVLSFPLTEEKIDQVLDILVDDDSKANIVVEFEEKDLDEVLLLLTNFSKINQHISELRGDVIALGMRYLSNSFYNIPDTNRPFWEVLESVLGIYLLSDETKEKTEKTDDKTKAMLEDYKLLLVQIIHHSVIQNNEKMDYTYYSRESIEARCEAEGKEFKLFSYNPNIQPLITSKTSLVLLLSLFMRYKGGTGYLDKGVFYFSNMENILCGSPYCPSVVIRFLLDKTMRKEDK